MAWKEKPQTRSISCNGEAVAHFRKQLGWTQQELADRAGYTKRLIAKAESSGSLNPETIDVIAEALSAPNDPVYPEDLACNPRLLAIEYVSNLEKYQSDAIIKSQHFLSEDIIFTMPGNPSILPFAGVHHGIEAMDRSCRIFCGFLQILSQETDFVMCEGNRVVISQRIHGKLRELKSEPPGGPAIVNYRIRFERGKIVELCHDYQFEDAEKATLIQQEMLRDELPES